MFTLTRQLKTSSRVGAVALSSMRQKHTLPPLAYEYKALEPVISGEIMELHHTKHHATYVNNLNVAEEQLREMLGSGTDKGMGSQLRIRFFLVPRLHPPDIFGVGGAWARSPLTLVSSYYIIHGLVPRPHRKASGLGTLLFQICSAR